MLLQIKPKSSTQNTRREGEHFHWFVKMIMHREMLELEKQKLASEEKEKQKK